MNKRKVGHGDNVLGMKKAGKTSHIHSSTFGVRIPGQRGENYHGVAEYVKKELRIKSFFENI